MSAGNAGAAIGLANTVKIGAVGAYVQNTVNPCASDAYFGTNAKTSYKTNVLGESISPDFIVEGNSGTVYGKNMQWVQSASTLVPGNRVNIAAGVATLNAAGTHDVYCNAVAGDYFWAVER